MLLMFIQQYYVTQNLRFDPYLDMTKVSYKLFSAMMSDALRFQQKVTNFPTGSSSLYQRIYYKFINSRLYQENIFACNRVMRHYCYYDCLTVSLIKWK